MKILNYSSLKTNLANILDQVNDDHSPVIITRQNGKAMARPKNAKRLNDAIAEIEASNA